MWALVFIFVSVNSLTGLNVADSAIISMHDRMDQCFVARGSLIGKGPKPKVNYEAVCINLSKGKPA